MDVQETKNTQQILKSRAEKLAKPIERTEQISEFDEVLVFNLGEEKYAIETKYVTEVYPHKNYTILPCAPAFVFGLANVRRKILLIIDLKVLFSIPNEVGSQKKLVILRYDHKSFAILSDGFTSIRKIPKEGLQASLPTLTGIREDFLKGLLVDGTVILDGQRLLNSKHLIVDEKVD